MSGKKTFQRNELTDLGTFSIAIGVHHWIIVSEKLMFVLCYEGFRVSVGGLRWGGSLAFATVFRGIRVTPQWSKLALYSHISSISESAISNIRCASPLYSEL